MARQTVDIPVIATAYVREDQPNTVFPTQAGVAYDVGGYAADFSRKRLYFQSNLSAFPAALVHQRLYGLQLELGWERGGDSCTMYVAGQPIDAATLTFNTAPDAKGYQFYGRPITPGTGWEDVFIPPEIKANDGYTPQSASSFFSYGGCVYLANDRTRNEAQNVRSTLMDGSAPFIRIHYDDTDRNHSKILIVTGPTSGYRNPAMSTRFSWYLLSDDTYQTASNRFSQQSAVLSWKAVGDSSYTQISIPDGTMECNVPANTFPRGTNISWFVTAIDDTGESQNSSVYTFTTADSDTTTTPESPVNTIEDGSLPITFYWSYYNPNGTTPTRMLLEYSYDADASEPTWTTITDVQSPITEYTTPANYFVVGNVTWRITAYNSDGVAGPASTARFVCIASPGPPNITSVDEVPFASITWQAEGQQAYRIELDDVEQGTFFGQASSYTFREPLSDGMHIVSLYVQGAYGLWSEGVPVVLTITNSPGPAVTLTADLALDAQLSWITADTDRDFMIYRDDVLIGRTNQLSFRDWMVLGEHYWHVINRLPNGNYTRSNTVGGTLTSDIPMIAALPAAEWVELPLADQELRAEEFSYNRIHSLRHITGTAYPLLELSPYEDLSANYTTAFKNASDARVLDALKGLPVIIKTKSYGVMIGALTDITKTINGFYLAYQFTVRRILWEDFRDESTDN